MNSASRSLTCHHAVSKKRFGSSAAYGAIQPVSLIPAWARISRAPGCSRAMCTTASPRCGIPRPAWNSTASRSAPASATISSTTGCGSANPSERGWSLKPRAPASRQRRASAIASGVFGSIRASAWRRPPDAAQAASTRSLAGG